MGYKSCFMEGTPFTHELISLGPTFFSLDQIKGAAERKRNFEDWNAKPAEERQTERKLWKVFNATSVKCAAMPLLRHGAFARPFLIFHPLRQSWIFHLDLPTQFIFYNPFCNNISPVSRYKIATIFPNIYFICLFHEEWIFIFLIEFFHPACFGNGSRLACSLRVLVPPRKKVQQV